MDTCEQNNSVPLAIDIYYDDWKVSNLNSIGGLYFTIANLPKHLHWQVKHKFLICLVPYGETLQNIIPTVLQDIKRSQAPLYIQWQNKQVSICPRLARLIADIPACAEFCSMLGHAGNIFLILKFMN